MAEANNKIALSFILVLMLSLLLITGMADESFSGSSGNSRKDFIAPCTVLHGVKAGETCFSVIQQSNMSAEIFGLINPNLDCDNLFVGQWLCVV